MSPRRGEAEDIWDKVSWQPRMFRVGGIDEPT
jgi:hypothetical protein